MDALAIDDVAGLVLNRHVLRADVTIRIDLHRGDAGSAKVVFREEFVAHWPAHGSGATFARIGDDVRCVTR
jgi:hypothetical protein